MATSSGDRWRNIEKSRPPLFQVAGSSRARGKHARHLPGELLFGCGTHQGINQALRCFPMRRALKQGHTAWHQNAVEFRRACAIAQHQVWNTAALLQKIISVGDTCVQIAARNAIGHNGIAGHNLRPIFLQRAKEIQCFGTPWRTASAAAQSEAVPNWGLLMPI